MMVKNLVYDRVYVQYKGFFVGVQQQGRQRCENRRAAALMRLRNSRKEIEEIQENTLLKKRYFDYNIYIIEEYKPLTRKRRFSGTVIKRLTEV